MSPERFLAFDGDRVIGEPMKGTRPRGRSMAEDDALYHELKNDPKERSENIMALDVMRHDLSQVAAPHSVRVEELCGIRSFPQIHQMVSTVAARIAHDRSPHPHRRRSVLWPHSPQCGECDRSVEPGRSFLFGRTDHFTSSIDRPRGAQCHPIALIRWPTMLESKLGPARHGFPTRCRLK